MSEAKVRLYVDQALAAGQPVAVGDAQANYLFNVMRLATGAGVLLFNGRDGEWLATVAEAGKRRGVLVCSSKTADLRLPPDLWLVFAPIKKDRTHFIVEKAVELGVSRIMPIQTRRTNAERVRQDKLLAHAMEAAEQCGATFVPEVAELITLDRVLATWPAERRLLWCDEAKAGEASLPHGPRGQPWAILIGPEGGFAEDEQARLRGIAQVVPLSLGPRILRADTAAVAAMTLWQAKLGDWG
ncbi:MAG: 16S rRNA (uracil(1498)-N(3))-methyltransferase [Paracoccaceae bacterium]